jgi:hypothetical protein
MASRVIRLIVTCLEPGSATYYCEHRALDPALPNSIGAGVETRVITPDGSQGNGDIRQSTRWDDRQLNAQDWASVAY